MNDEILRKQLVTLLKGGEAHGEVGKQVRAYPSTIAGLRIGSMPFTPWQLLEHMRIAQWDILKFCIDPDHVSPKFPDGYWPEADKPPDLSHWDQTVTSFCRDLKSMTNLTMDPGMDLFSAIPHGQGQTLFREVLLVADHNAYHLGQLLLILKSQK
jgi:hypothetical protein